MKILNKLTYRYLNLNKRKCITTLVSIILITVLLFSVGIFVSTIRKTLYDSIVNENGTKHVLFRDISYDNYGILNNNENIKSIEITCLIDIINDELYITSIDDTLWDSISISKGSFPNNINEIVISNTYAQTYNLTIGSNINEKIIVGIYDNNTLNNNIYYAYTVSANYKNENVSFYITYENLNNIYNKIYNTAEELGLETIPIPSNLILYENTSINTSYLQVLGKFPSFDTTLAVYAFIFFILFVISLFCILIVRNAFTINLVERKKQFATLRSIGASKLQIIKMVIIEAFMLSVIAIPIGIILSIIISLFIIGILNNILENLIAPINIYFYPSLIIISLIFIIFTIFASAFVPAIKASKTSPISGIKPVYNLKKTRENYPLINKIFGPIGVLAYKNTKRDKNKFNSCIISMTISIVLFLTFAYVSENVLVYSENTFGEPFDIDITISEDEVLRREILSIPNIDEEITYKNTMLQYKYNNNYTKEFLDSRINNDNVLGIMVLGVEDSYYNKYFNTDSLVIINGNDYEIFKNENIPIELVDNEFSQNVYFTINNYELINFDTKLFQTNMPIIVLRLDDYNNFFNTYRKDININNYYIVINSDKPEIFDRYMNDIIDDNLEQNIEYMNYAYHDYEGRQVMSAIKFVGFTIIIAIALLSISAVFNTLNTNILTREKEFAMLRSIGLSKKDLNKLLIFEGIFLGLKTLIISLIVYIILLFGIKKFINFLSIASLKKLVFPIKYLVIAYIILLLVILLVIMYSKHKIKNKNIVDAIKNENI